MLIILSHSSCIQMPVPLGLELSSIKKQDDGKEKGLLLMLVELLTKLSGIMMLTNWSS